MEGVEETAVRVWSGIGAEVTAVRVLGTAMRVLGAEVTAVRVLGTEVTAVRVLGAEVRVLGAEVTAMRVWRSVCLPWVTDPMQLFSNSSLSLASLSCMSLTKLEPTAGGERRPPQLSLEGVAWAALIDLLVANFESEGEWFLPGPTSLPVPDITLAATASRETALVTRDKLVTSL